MMMYKLTSPQVILRNVSVNEAEPFIVPADETSNQSENRIRKENVMDSNSLHFSEYLLPDEPLGEFGVIVF